MKSLQRYLAIHHMLLIPVSDELFSRYEALMNETINSKVSYKEWETEGEKILEEALQGIDLNEFVDEWEII